MTDTLSDEKYQEAREQERAREEVHPLDWKDDFGPLKYTDLTDFVRHLTRFEREEDRRKQEALALELGYRDAFHFGRVRVTFLKYYGHQNAGAKLVPDPQESAPPGPRLRNFVWQEPGFSEAITRAAALERAQPPKPSAKPQTGSEPSGAPKAKSAPAVAKQPDRATAKLIAPEEGITLEQYAGLCAIIAARQPALPELQEMLAPASMDLAKWERVNRAWVTRMLGDTSLTLNHLFAKAYASAGAGHLAATPIPAPAASQPSAPAASSPAVAPSAPIAPVVPAVSAASAKAPAGTQILASPPPRAKSPSQSGSSPVPPEPTPAPAAASVKVPPAAEAASASSRRASAPVGDPVSSSKRVASMQYTAPMQTVRGPEPMPLERFAEIGVAMSVWANRSRDTSAMLSHVYHMTPTELAAVSMYWQRRFEAEAALLAEYSRLQDALKIKFTDPMPEADLHY